MRLLRAVRTCIRGEADVADVERRLCRQDGRLPPCAGRHGDCVASDMIYLPPTSIIPFANGVPGTTIVIGAPILIGLGLAFALCLGAIAVGSVAGWRSRRRGTVRWPAIIVTAGGVFARRRAREA